MHTIEEPAWLTYYRTAERPAIKLWLLDDDDTLIDLSTASFVFKLGEAGEAAVFTKNTGIAGAAGSGTDIDMAGVPNVTISFAAGELDSVAAGTWRWQVRATSSSLDRVYQGWLELLDVIT